MSETADGVATNLYHDSDFDIDAAKLLPGEYYATGENMMLVTVLGSCVAACIRDPQSGVGGMNHFMLPESGHEADSPLSRSARYGAYAMEILIDRLIRLGARRNRLEAKAFGGGSVLRGFTVNSVGECNSIFVQDYLAGEGIRLVAQDLLDVYPRKVCFFPASGRALVKRLRLHDDTLLEREREYSARLSSAGAASRAELAPSG